MVEEALTGHPSLVLMWKALLALNPTIDISGDGYGTYDCTLSVTTEDGSRQDTHYAANRQVPAIYGAIRSAFNRLTGRHVPVDDKAYVDDYEID